MIISGADLDFARACQESIMIDTGRLRRQTGETYDPDQGATVPVYTTLYEGKGRAQVDNSQGSQPVIVGDLRTVQNFMCAVPYTVTDIQAGDEWVTLTSNDPRAVGRVLSITAVHSSTFATARRFSAEEVS